MANFSDPPEFAASLADVQAALAFCARGLPDAPEWVSEFYGPALRRADARETRASQVLRRWRERNGL